VWSVVREAALKVSNYLTSGVRSSAVFKPNASGDFTKAFDKESEDIIFDVLRGLGECLLIVSEESGVVKTCGEGWRWVFVVDPVDGSVNYEASIPWVSVSIAVAPYEEGVTLNDVTYAVVVDVFRKTTYEYVKGEGVLIDGVKPERRVKPPNVLLGYFETPEAYSIVPKYWRVRGGRAALRSLGSAALDIIYVGLGRAEAFVDIRAKLRNVDVAAALKIAEALNAKAMLCDGTPVNNIPLTNISKVECLLVGYDDAILSKLIEAYRS